MAFFLWLLGNVGRNGKPSRAADGVARPFQQTLPRAAPFFQAVAFQGSRLDSNAGALSGMALAKLVAMQA
jgi:hypothetical protein